MMLVIIAALCFTQTAQAQSVDMCFQGKGSAYPEHNIEMRFYAQYPERNFVNYTEIYTKKGWKYSWHSGAIKISPDRDRIWMKLPKHVKFMKATASYNNTSAEQPYRYCAFDWLPDEYLSMSYLLDDPITKKRFNLPLTHVVVYAYDPNRPMAPRSMKGK